MKVYKCCGCGVPYDDGYSNCECATQCGFNGDIVNDVIVAKPRCDWCKGRDVAHNIDGDNLCLPCCNKWARGEGIAAQEAALSAIKGDKS